MICFDDDEDLEFGLPREDGREPTADAGEPRREDEGETAGEPGGTWSSLPWRDWTRFLQERLRRAS